jgi:hypothetical protein
MARQRSKSKPAAEQVNGMLDACPLADARELEEMGRNLGPAVQPLDRAHVAARNLANWSETLYFDFMTEQYLPWPKSDHPGGIEIMLSSMWQTCRAECAPFMSKLRSLYGPGDVQGWDRIEACAVDAALTYSRRVLTQAARLRGEAIKDLLGEQPFEDLPTPQHGWLTSLVEREFALLTEALAAPSRTANGNHTRLCLDPVDRMKKAIGEAPDGKQTKPSVLIKQAGISQSKGREALRQLEEQGEYHGFARRPFQRP